MKTLKKLSAILLSVMILATLIPANFAFAATTFTPEYYDFEGYTDTSGTGKPSGFGMGGNGATMKPDNDEKYGTTVKIVHTASKKGPNLNKGFAVGNFPSSNILTIRTALKMDNKLANNGISFANVILTYFGKDGYIYIAGTKTSYTYDISTWYDVAVTFNKTTGYAEAVVNGGAYKNLVISGYNVAIKNMSITGTYVYTAIGSNISQDSNSYGAAFEIGYLSLYEGVFATPEISFKDDFEDGKLGGYVAAAGTTTATASIAMENDDKVLMLTDVNAYNGYAYKEIELPSTGTVKIGFLAKGPANTGRSISLVGKNEEGIEKTTVLAQFLNAANNLTEGNIHIGGSTPTNGLKWKTDKWHSVVLTLNMDTHTFSGEIKNQDEDYSLGSATGKAFVNIVSDVKLKFTVSGGSKGGNNAYFDDIYVKVDEPIRLQHMDIAPGTKNVFVSEEPTVYFTEEIDPETVNTENVKLTVNGVAVEDYTPEVGTDGKSIVIKHTELLAGKTKYTVSISNIASKDNSADIAASYSYSFTTAKAYELGAVSFGDATGALGETVPATVSIKFNDTVKHEVAFITAVYDKASGELVACDIDNRKGATAVEGSADLSATVTVPNVEGKTYEVYAYLWDGLTTLRPYIAATPLQ